MLHVTKFKVFNSVVQYQCICFVCFINKWFSRHFSNNYRKIRFNIYLFTFVVAIYSSSHDIKLTFATKTIFGPARNFENGCNVCVYTVLMWANGVGEEAVTRVYCGLKASRNHLTRLVYPERFFCNSRCITAN